MMSQNITPKNVATKNVAPIAITLTGQSGQRVILNTARRVLREHQKEIKALADK